VRSRAILPRTGQPLRRLDPVSEGQQATYTYNFLGFQRFTIAAQPPVPVWKASIRYEFAYDGGGVDAIFVNGKKVLKDGSNTPNPSCSRPTNEQMP